MIQLRPLLIIAVIANLLTIALYSYAASQRGGSGMAMLFGLVWMPVLWLLSIVATIIIAIIKRKNLFQKHILIWTVLTILFATPIPAIAFYYSTHPTPETRSYGMEGNTINGKAYKTEFREWTSTHRKFAYKYFVADSAQEATYGDKAYKRDSTWIYFDNNGDTLKLEYYKNDSLIATKQSRKE
jgi:hypothetical protein